MSDAAAELKKEALGWLKPVQMLHLATWDGERPRVRPVSMIFDGERFWVSTGTKDAKAAQIARDPGFEFSLMLEGEGSKGTLRGSGRARLVEDDEERRRVSEKIPFFKDFWETPEDPGFCLIELQVENMELMRPHEMTSTKFKI